MVYDILNVREVKAIKSINFTTKEIRALRELVSHGHMACIGDCVFVEMKKSRKNCTDCDYMKAIYSIEEKISEEE